MRKVGKLLCDQPPYFPQNVDFTLYNWYKPRRWRSQWERLPRMRKDGCSNPDKDRPQSGSDSSTAKRSATGVSAMGPRGCCWFCSGWLTLLIYQLFDFLVLSVVLALFHQYYDMCDFIWCAFVHMFVCWFTSHSRFFHSKDRWRASNFDLYSALMAIEQ